MNGILTYITSNKWMRTGYGEKLRSFFVKYNPKILIDLGPNVFENATVDTNILIIQKSLNQRETKAVSIKSDKKCNVNLGEEVRENSFVLSNLGRDAWFVGSNLEQRLKEKIERIGKPLKDWDVKIYYGIKTGLNEAFIIDSKKREEILANCKDEEERKRTEAIIKPILRGRDIKRYYYEWAELWVIWSYQGININEFPSLKNYLMQFKTELERRTGGARKLPNGELFIPYQWYELQVDSKAHIDEFEKEKGVWQRITQEPTFCIVEPNIFILDSMSFFTGENLKYILTILNSKLIYYYVKTIVHQYGYTGFRLSNQYVEIMPLPTVTSTNQITVNQIEQVVDQISAIKRKDKNADTSHLEKEIDQLVYKLYDLTEEEIRLVEGKG